MSIAQEIPAVLRASCEAETCSPESVEVLGSRISADGPDGATRRALALMDSGVHGHYIACANPHSLAVADRDPGFREALRNADILTPDGVGVVLAGKILSRPPFTRVVGYDLFTRLSESASRRSGVRFFFLGSSEQVLERIVERMAGEFPGITVCGAYAPPFAEEFQEEENDRILQVVNAAQPHVLWVGMTAPKQEKWIFRNRHRLRVPLTAAVGAVFDFFAGTQKRAPRWVQAAGMEWLFRFAMEPKRLWSRTLRSSPLFVKMVVLEKMRRIRR